MRALMLLGGLVLVALAIRLGIGDTASETPHPADSTDATIVCQKFVTDQLRAPSTAVFSPDSETAASHIGIADKPDTWRVQGWVDSQNSFGAQIRSRYDCVATVTGYGKTGWNFRSESVSITPR